MAARRSVLFSQFEVSTPKDMDCRLNHSLKPLKRPKKVHSNLHLTPPYNPKLPQRTERREPWPWNMSQTLPIPRPYRFYNDNQAEDQKRVTNQKGKVLTEKG